MLTVIYVPGLADDVGYVQSSLVRLLRLRNVRGITHVMPWAGDDDYPLRAERLLQKIDKLTKSGKKVFLIGSSAGATAVINAYVERRNQVAGVILICPKINNSNNVDPRVIQKNPSFYAALKKEITIQATLTSVDKARMSIFVSPTDGLLKPSDSLVPDIKTFQLAPLRHSLAILHGLSLGFGTIKAELQRISTIA